MPRNDTVVIDPRFQGIPKVALGGYVGGLLAGDLSGAEVVFRRPVPMGKPLRVEAKADQEAELLDGQDLLATVRRSHVDVRPPTSVTLEASELATREYPGFRRHLFPNCFTCGPARSEADGLRIFAGPVSGRDVVASPWTPNPDLAASSGEVAREYVWSALDCPSIWALAVQEPLDSSGRFVSARMVVEQLAPVRPAEPHVVMAWGIGRDGRTRTGGAAILSPAGVVCALATHTLKSTDWGVPLSLANWK